MTTLLKFNLFVVVAGLNSPFVPLLEGHVPDDVTAMASTKDEEAGHDQVSDVEQGPGLHPETLQEVIRHGVQVFLKIITLKLKLKKVIDMCLRFPFYLYLSVTADTLPSV